MNFKTWMKLLTTFWKERKSADRHYGYCLTGNGIERTTG